MKKRLLKNIALLGMVTSAAALVTNVKASGEAFDGGNFFGTGTAFSDYMSTTSFEYDDVKMGWLANDWSTFIYGNESVKADSSYNAKRLSAVVGAYWGAYQEANDISMIVYEDLESNTDFAATRHVFGLTSYQDEYVEGFELGYYKGFEWLGEFIHDFDWNLNDIYFNENDSFLYFKFYQNKLTLGDLSSVTIKDVDYALTKVPGQDGLSEQLYYLKDFSTLLTNLNVSDTDVAVDIYIDKFNGLKDGEASEVTCNEDNFTYYRKQVATQIEASGTTIQKAVTYKWFANPFNQVSYDQILTGVGFNLTDKNGKALENVIDITLAFQTPKTYKINKNGKTTGEVVAEEQAIVNTYDVIDDESLLLYNSLKKGASNQGVTLTRYAVFTLFSGPVGLVGNLLYDQSQSNNWSYFNKLHNNFECYSNAYLLNNRNMDYTLDMIYDDNSYTPDKAFQIKSVLHDFWKLDCSAEKNKEIKDLWNNYNYSFVVPTHLLDTNVGDGVEKVAVIKITYMTDENEVRLGTTTSSGLFINDNNKVVNVYGEEQSGYEAVDGIIYNQDGEVIDYNSKTELLNATSVKSPTESELVELFDSIFEKVSNSTNNLFNSNPFSGIANATQNVLNILVGALAIVAVVFIGSKAYQIVTRR